MTETGKSGRSNHSHDFASSGEQVQSEIHESLHVLQQRRRLFPRAALVGLLAGAVATAFRATLALGDRARNALISWAHHIPVIGVLFPVGACAAGAAISIVLVRRYAPEVSGGGIPHLETVLHRVRELRWRRVLFIKYLAGSIGISSGLALGREGPTVQMGGAVGAAVSSWMNVSARDRLVLIAAGAGAGLAAAFNAPLAGVIFVLEEVQKDFQTGGIWRDLPCRRHRRQQVARFASGSTSTVFAIPSYPVPALTALPAFAVLGIVSGLLGVVYNRCLIGSLNLFAKFKGRWAVFATAIVGAMAGLIAWYSPGAVGGGHQLAEHFLAGHIAIAAIPLWFLVRFVLSMGSYGTGTAGGIFAPLLVLGALIGLGIGEATHHFYPRLDTIGYMLR